MSRYTLKPGVRDDLKEISSYIAQENPRAAKRLRGAFSGKFRFLADNPFAGEARDDLAPGVRMVSTGNYVILFQPSKHGVEIVQIVHGARDLKPIFRKPEQM